MKNDMTDSTLSPAAQAVLDATGRKTWYRNNDIAAALRAAANEVCLRWAELQHPSDVLNAIAAELEGGND